MTYRTKSSAAVKRSYSRRACTLYALATQYTRAPPPARIVVRLGHPVQPGPALGAHGVAQPLEQGGADAAATCARAHVQVFHVAHRLGLPGVLVHHAMREAVDLAIDLGHDAHHLRIRVEDAAPRPARDFVGQLRLVELAVALPEFTPDWLVGGQGGTDDASGRGHLFIVPGRDALMCRGWASSGP